MIKLKTDKDIKFIEKAIQIGMNTLDYAENLLKQIGITTKELDYKIEKFILKNNAIPSFKGYQNFPGACCISINEEIIHGIPSDRKIQNGDVIKIDVGINYKNYFSDQAKTYIVGNYLQNPYNVHLLEATKEALFRAKHIAKRRHTLNMIACEIQNTAEEFGVNTLKDFAGHGVGFAVHEEPKVFNEYGKNDLITLKKGMVLAIEPMFTLGDGNYKIHSDGWTIITNGIGAHFEETVIIK